MGRKFLTYVGCGTGEWCCVELKQLMALIYIQEEMVKLTKQATLGLSKVHIQMGDASDMP